MMMLRAQQVKTEHRLVSEYWPGFIALGFALLAFFPYLAGKPMQTDISWLLIVGERVLGGDRLYIDISELNPPFSVLLYLPPIQLGRTLGVSAEIMTALQLMLWAFFNLVLAKHIAGRADLFPQLFMRWFWPVGVFTFVLVIPNTFAQREHFAALGVLPMSMLLTGRYLGRDFEPDLWICFLVGLSASSAVMVKPHYLLPFVFAGFLVIAANRSVKPLLKADMVFAAFFTSAYYVSVFVFWPDYIRQMIPLLTEAYTARRQDFLSLLLFNNPAVPALVLTAGFLIWKTKPQARRAFDMLISAAIGFLVVYFIMGKGWDYHAMPFARIMAFVLAGLALMQFAKTSERETQSSLVPVALVFICTLFLFPAQLQTVLGNHHRPFYENSTIKQAMLQSTSGDSVAVISLDIATGHPFARYYGLKWAEQYPSDWPGGYAFEKLFFDENLDPALRSRLENRVEREVAAKAENFARVKPTYVLMRVSEKPWIDRIMQNRTMADQLTHYEAVTEADNIRLLKRKID